LECLKICFVCRIAAVTHLFNLFIKDVYKQTVIWSIAIAPTNELSCKLEV
jgi:hypothetical protein